MTVLNRLNSPKLDFTQNRSGSKITKYQQSQDLTSHFESFWSIVILWYCCCVHVAKEGKTSLLIAVCYYFYLWLSPITQMYLHENKSKKQLLDRNEAKKDNLEVFKVVHHL